MRTLLNDIRDKLNATNLFRYIDDDNGQLDDYAAYPPTKWPCALVDIIEAKPESLGRGVQNLDCTILIRVADLKLSNSSQQAPSGQKLKSAELFGIAHSVFAQLHGWHKEDSSYGTLSRSGFRRYHRDDGIREYHILFRSLVRDVVAAITTEDLSEMVPEDIRPEITIVIDDPTQ
jgi:hypothetical protein